MWALEHPCLGAEGIICSWWTPHRTCAVGVNGDKCLKSSYKTLKSLFQALVSVASRGAKAVLWVLTAPCDVQQPKDVPLAQPSVQRMWPGCSLSCPHHSPSHTSPCSRGWGAWDSTPCSVMIHLKLVLALADRPQSTQGKQWHFCCSCAYPKGFTGWAQMKEYVVLGRGV